MHGEPLFKLIVVKRTRKPFIYITVLSPEAHTCILAFTYDLKYLFSIFKGTAAWDFTCFTWPIYTDLYCNSCSWFIFLEVKCHTVFTFYWEIIIFSLLLVKLLWPSGPSFSLDLKYFFIYFKTITIYWRQFVYKLLS